MVRATKHGPASAQVNAHWIHSARNPNFPKVVQTLLFRPMAWPAVFGSSTLLWLSGIFTEVCRLLPMSYTDGGVVGGGEHIGTPSACPTMPAPTDAPHVYSFT